MIIFLRQLKTICMHYFQVEKNVNVFLKIVLTSENSKNHHWEFYKTERFVRNRR